MSYAEFWQDLRPPKYPSEPCQKCRIDFGHTSANLYKAHKLYYPSKETIKLSPFCLNVILRNFLLNLFLIMRSIFLAIEKGEDSPFSLPLFNLSAPLYAKWKREKGGEANEHTANLHVWLFVVLVSCSVDQNKLFSQFQTFFEAN